MMKLNEIKERVKELKAKEEKVPDLFKSTIDMFTTYEEQGMEEFSDGDRAKFVFFEIIYSYIFTLIYTIIELGSQFLGNSNIAHMTHLFGFLGAWLYFVIRMGIHPMRIWKDTYRR